MSLQTAVESPALERRRLTRSRGMPLTATERTAKARAVAAEHVEHDTTYVGVVLLHAITANA